MADFPWQAAAALTAIVGALLTFHGFIVRLIIRNENSNQDDRIQTMLAERYLSRELSDARYYELKGRIELLESDRPHRGRFPREK